MKKLREQMQNSKLKYGGYSAIVTFVIVVGIIILNLLIQQLGWQLDLTERNVYTLSQQTREILDELEEDVTIYYLARQNEEDPQIMEAIDRYARLSNRVRIEVVDAERNPAFVSRYDPEGQGLRNGSVIVTSGDKYRAIQGVDLFSVDRRNPQAPRVLGLNVERRITNALIFVGTGRTPIIYQVSGHGELDLSRGGAFGRLGEQFENVNFELRTINVATATQIPEDGAVLAMVRPRTDISEDEAAKIAEFMANGGKAFFALDFEVGEVPNIASLLEGYGIGVPPAIIIDPNRNFNNGEPLQLWPQLAETSITEPLIEADYRVLTPLSRPVTILDTKPRGVEIEVLMQTSGDGFYRTDLDNANLSLSADDVPGPVPVALRAIEREFTTGDEISRLVVIGDADFVSLVDQVNGNLDFILNSFSWLEQQEETISIRPQTTLQFPMNLTGMQSLIFAAIFIAIIPLAILISGLVIWLRRRHL
ncbi:MAG: GldG family protein [Spirochaetales bacterium]